MKKQSTDTRKLFDFYTYNPCGQDVIIPIRGVDEDDAWDTFTKLYSDHAGIVPIVDQIMEVK